MIPRRSDLWPAALLCSIALVLAGCGGTIIRKIKPSDVFFSGPNSKTPENVIRKDVIMAGWLLTAPGKCADPPSSSAESSCEDAVFDLIPDPDFIADNLEGPNGFNTTLRGASLPGNPADPSKRLSLDDGGRGITLNSFLLPGNFAANYWRNLALEDIRKQCEAEGKPDGCRELFPAVSIHVELNAWNVNGDRSPSNPEGFDGRGRPPEGWIPDPNGRSDVFWPFNSKDPDGKGDLKAGDYVMISGTLWQDVPHYGKGTGMCRTFGGWLCGDNPSGNRDLEQQDCWGRGALKPHGGWIELHPIDWMIRAEPKQDRPRKTIAGVALCAPVELFDVSRATDVKIAPVVPRPSPSSSLRVVELVDPRFTDERNVDEHTVSVVGDQVEVHVKVHSSGTLSFQAREGRFKAVYRVWWE